MSGEKPGYLEKIGEQGLLDMEKIVSDEWQRRGLYGYVFGMTVATANLILAIFMIWSLAFNSDFRKKYDPQFTAGQSQQQTLESAQEIYVIKDGDCSSKVLKQRYPNLSKAKLYKFIDDVVSPANGKGKMADYSIKDRSRGNPHLWYAGESMKIPIYKL